MCSQAYGWEHEIAVGYGFGQEVGEDYQNQGFTINGKLYKFPKIDNTLYATIDGSLSHWTANTDTYSQLTTAAISANLRAYFANPLHHTIRPYIAASTGPAYLSSEQFGDRRQGSHFDLQSTIEAGTEIATSADRAIDINLHLVHYCNAGLFEPNEGFNVLYVFSIGYQF
ncbi:MAG: acyloxyacyl hydrolase [Gammaproteobacteria bacterium]